MARELPSPRRIAAVASIVVLAVATLGCNQLVLRTALAPQEACDAALTGGRLVSSRESGLAIQPPGQPTLAVTWPFGYKAGGFVGSLELQDETGRVLAREGDVIEVGGGLGGDGSWIACAGTVRLVRAESSVPLFKAEAPADGCMQALITGTLVIHPDSGLVIKTRNREVPVEWPVGYTARERPDGVELLDEHGTVVAREGDQISLGGGEVGPDGSGFWRTCGEITGPRVLVQEPR